MKLGVYMDNVSGQLAHVYKDKRWEEHLSLATISDGYWKGFYRIEYSSKYGHHYLERDSLSELAWELRNHTYLGKL